MPGGGGVLNYWIDVGRPILIVNKAVLWAEDSPLFSECGFDVTSCFKPPLSQLPCNDGHYIELGTKLNPFSFTLLVFQSMLI